MRPATSGKSISTVKIATDICGLHHKPLNPGICVFLSVGPWRHSLLIQSNFTKIKSMIQREPFSSINFLSATRLHWQLPRQLSTVASVVYLEDTRRLPFHTLKRNTSAGLPAMFTVPGLHDYVVMKVTFTVSNLAPLITSTFLIGLTRGRKSRKTRAFTLN